MWQREDFLQYRDGMSLSEFTGKVPLFRMEDLRDHDYMISRGISYERTAYTFLAQMAFGESMRRFTSDITEVVLLLNEEGAIIREKGQWDLVFTPDKTEQLTLTNDQDLYPVYVSLMEKVERGEACRIRLQDVSISSLMSGRLSLDILDHYCANQPGGYLAVAKKVVLDGPDELFRNVPVSRCGGLTSVDLDEREAYNSIQKLLNNYVYEVEHAGGSSVRPLSISVFGAPGSGKSFGVKQIAKSIGKFDICTINLSQYSDYDEMLAGLNAALKKAKRIPLIFFDEFDSDYKGNPRGWLKYLLAPMQDGEYTLGGEIITIPNAVFVFAGGTASSFNQFQPSSDEEAEAFKLAKGPDFVSRLKGMLNVKGPNPVSVTDRAYLIRRAMLLSDLIKRNVPGICDPDTGHINISDGLLYALLTTSSFKHGTRSMEFILSMSDLSGATRFTPSCLPLRDQLDIHLDYMDLETKLTYDRLIGSNNDKYVIAAHEKMRTKRLADAMRMGTSEDGLNALKSQRSMLPWNELNEKEKDLYRERTRSLVEKLLSVNCPVGIRPVTSGMPDTVTELYGSNLVHICEMQYSIWKHSLEADGWRYGPVYDEASKVSPSLIPYDELSEESRGELESEMRELPKYLTDLGMELYRKAI